jgi:hypothetical protein
VVADKEETGIRQKQEKIQEKQKKIIQIMMKITGRFICLFLILAASGMITINCATKKSSAPPPPWLAADAPKSDEMYFYGVGCAQHRISNYYFKRGTARERARVDLAINMHEYLMAELSGDTTEARRVIESVLPGREVDETYLDEEGNLCARARVSRNKVEDLISDR